MLKNLGFGTKLYLGTFGVVLLTVIIMVAVNIWQTRKSYLQQGSQDIVNSNKEVYFTVDLLNRIVNKGLKSEMGVMQSVLSSSGKPIMNQNKMAEIQLKDGPGEGQKLEIPKMMYGLDFVTLDNTLVKRISEYGVEDPSIYQLVENKLICVSAKKDSGLLGSYLDGSKGILEKIRQNKEVKKLFKSEDQYYLSYFKPIKSSFDQKVVGAVNVRKKLFTPVFKRLIQNTQVDGKGFAFVSSKKGRVILSGNQALQGQDLSDLPYGKDLLQVKDELLEYTAKGDKAFAHRMFYNPWDLNLFFSMSKQEVMSGVSRKILKNSLASTVLALLLALVVIWLMKRELMKVMHKLAEMAKEVAKGNFEIKVDYQAKDAIKDTIDSITEMVKEIKNKLGFSQGLMNSLPIPFVVSDKEEKIISINQEALDYLEFDKSKDEILGMSVGEFFYNDPERKTIIGRAIEQKAPILNVQTEGTTRKGNKVYLRVDAAPLYDLDGEFIAAYVLYSDMTEVKRHEQKIEKQNQAIMEVAKQIEEISQRVSSASEEMSAQISESSRGAEHQKGRIGDTATSMEEMNATILEAAQNSSDAAQSADQAKTTAEKGKEIVGQVVQAITEVQEKSSSLKQDINELGRQAESVGKIMNVIEDIADQTNLLALNAAIEAARAGEAGRGFAVVADEVRKLAEKTMSATKEVGESIRAIQEGTQKNIQSTESTVRLISESTELVNQAGSGLEEIVSIVGHSAEQIRSIATAIEEQSSASEEINQAVEEVNRISSETSESMQHSAEAVQELNQQAQSLHDLIGRLQSL